MRSPQIDTGSAFARPRAGTGQQRPEPAAPRVPAEANSAPLPRPGSGAVSLVRSAVSEARVSHSFVRLVSVHCATWPRASRPRAALRFSARGDGTVPLGQDACAARAPPKHEPACRCWLWGQRYGIDGRCETGRPRTATHVKQGDVLSI